MELALHSALSFSALAAANLISAIWQGAVLAAAVALCLRFLPRLSAASRSLVWLATFLFLVCLHVLPLMPGGAAGTMAEPGAKLHFDLRWSLAIAAIWAMLSLWRAVQLLLSAVRLRQLAHRAIPIATSPELAALMRSSRRPVALCVSDEVSRPSVFGFFRPRILLPPGLLERLSHQELCQVVLHEMEHLRRGDDWTNLLQKLAVAIFPLNPALLWVERRLCAERELACDDRVLAASGGGRAYALCLTRLAEFSMVRRGLSLALGAWHRRPELARRIHRLLRRPHTAMKSWQARTATAALVMAVTGGAFELARSPQFVAFTASPQIHSAAAAAPGSIAEAVVYHRENRSQGIGAAHMVEAKAVISAGPAHGTAKPVKKRAVRGSNLRPHRPDGSGWMVLTEWTDAALPPHAVLAVKLDPRGSYAAVPVKGGWLIVQI